jgi:hypothetical protein
MGNVSDKVVEKIKTHISCSITLKKRNVCEKNMVKPDRTQMTLKAAQKICDLHGGN